METKTFTFKMQTEQNLIANETPSQRVLEISVQAPDSTSSSPRERAGLNLALVLDRSGSMGGEKLEYARQAAIYVLDQLSERDRVALVAYDDQVTLLSDSVLVTSEARQALKRSIQTLRPGGSTNLSDGWLTGCQQVATHLGTNQVNRALLLTDGLANVGITDIEALGTHARELASRGVSTSTFGVGEGFNEQLLEQMANLGSGNFYYIATPMEIPTIFIQEFSELASVTARDVEVTLEIPAGVDATLLGGWRSDNAGGSLRIFLGSLQAARQQDVYVNLLLPPAGSQPQLTIRGKAMALDMDGQVCESRAEIAFVYARGDIVQSAGAQQDVLERAAQVRLAESANEALKLERKGQPEEAARMLKKAIEINRAHLPEAMIETYENLARRMLRGMEERDRKSSHNLNYKTYRRRE